MNFWKNSDLHKLTSFDAENGAERKKSHNYKYWWAVLYGLPIFRVDIHSNLLTDLGRRYMNVLEEIKKIFIDFLYHTPKENLNTEIKRTYPFLWRRKGRANY